MDPSPTADASMRHGHHHGEPERRLDFDGFSVLRLRYAALYADAPHRHENSAIVTPFAGAAYQRRGTVEDLRAPGMHRYHLEQERHADRIGPRGWSTIVIEMRADWAAELRDAVPAFRFGFDSADSGADCLVRRLAEALDHVESRAATLRAQGIAYEIVAALADADPCDPRGGRPIWIGRAREYVATAYRERPTLEQIARVVHVHPVHLARSFRRWYGESVGAYGRRLRAEEALRLLDEGEMSVSEIAAALKYTTSHLAALMQGVYGASPRNLRSSRHQRSAAIASARSSVPS